MAYKYNKNSEKYIELWIHKSLKSFKVLQNL